MKIIIENICCVVTTIALLFVAGILLWKIIQSANEDLSCKKMRDKKRKTTLAEFSKKVIAALVIVWFIGFLIGAAVVVVQLLRGDYTVSLSDLLLYIGAPMTGGIVSYMLKSAFENKEKIRKNLSVAYGDSSPHRGAYGEDGESEVHTDEESAIEIDKP